MNNPPGDAELSRLLSLAAHELRNPLSTVLGYIGFVMRDRRGEVSDQHRQWLELAINSCNRLREVVEQISEYAKLESGEIQFNRKATDLGTVLSDAIQALPAMIDRNVTVDLSTEDKPGVIQADEPWLKRAFSSIVGALRLEVGATNKLYVEQRAGEYQGTPASWILIGDAEQIEALRQQPKDALGWFDDKHRGNLGLTLWIARRVLAAHGGAIWAHPAASKGGGAAVALPNA